MSDRPVVLELRGITKRFPGVLANDHIDFDLRRGEVHALLGENGAGKSTLMSILYGLYHPDEGEIWVTGEQVRIDSPQEAIERGIGMVHQHFMLIPVMTVAENIVLATEPTKAGVVLDFATAGQRVRGARGAVQLRDRPRRTDREHLGRPAAAGRDPEGALPRAPTSSSSTSRRRCSRRRRRRSSSASSRTLQREGMSIIFISHKLNEVLEIADRITVLRRGKKIETLPAAGATEEGLAQLMVGREVLLRVDKAPAHPAEPVLEVEDLHVLDDRELEAVRGVSFDVRAGEIVGDRRRRRQRPDRAHRGADRASPGRERRRFASPSAD